MEGKSHSFPSNFSVETGDGVGTQWICGWSGLSGVQNGEKGEPARESCALMGDRQGGRGLEVTRSDTVQLRE